MPNQHGSESFQYERFLPLYLSIRLNVFFCFLVPLSFLLPDIFYLPFHVWNRLTRIYSNLEIIYEK